MAEAILASGTSEVLVVRGDPPHDLSRQTYPNTSPDIIRRFKRRLPKLKVFAGFVCADMLRGHNVFQGIAPVAGPRSRAYRETTNKIAFPSDFTPTLDWSRAFAGSPIRAIRNLGSNAYLMPIRVDLAKYLSRLI